MSTASKFAKGFLTDLAARAFEKAAQKGVEGALRFAGGLSDRVRDDVYERYTDPFMFSKDNKVNKAPGQDRPYGTVWDPKAEKNVTGNVREVEHFYTPAGARVEPLRPEVEVPEGEIPFNRPRYDADTRSWAARGTKEPTEGWQRLFYENPEVTAQVAGYSAPIAVAGTALGGVAAGSWLFGEEKKPQSDYRVPVQPSKHQGGYNPSVESALASASAKYELQRQKHDHDMELQRFRMEAKTPGSQGSDPFSAKGDPFGDPFGAPTKFGMI